MNYVSGVKLAPLVFFPVEKNHLQLEVVLLLHSKAGWDGICPGGVRYRASYGSDQTSIEMGALVVKDLQYYPKQCGVQVGGWCIHDILNFVTFCTACLQISNLQIFANS